MAGFLILRIRIISMEAFVFGGTAFYFVFLFLLVVDLPIKRIHINFVALYINVLVLNLSIQVYINSSNVDDYLVESITRPAQDPNAGEVYYRYMIISILISLNVC